MNDNPVVFSIKSGIGRCILNAPPRNEMNMRFFEALNKAASDAAASDIRGMMIYGAGRHFSSGADVAELLRIYRAGCTGEVQPFLTSNLETFGIISSLPFPVIAAVSGCCLGAGLELALSCRYIIASENSVFSLPETGFGIMPGCGGTVRLTRKAGAAAAAELILSAKTVTAQDALKMGIIDEITGRKDLLSAAETYCRRS